MIVALVVICLLVLAWVVYASMRGEVPSSLPPRPLSPRPPVRAKPRFSGRRVEAAPAAIRSQPRSGRARMRNGEKVAAVRNGEVVTPANAIGLGCLAPISECRLGDRCICLNQHERQARGL
jgi:hypothetical protein